MSKHNFFQTHASRQARCCIRPATFQAMTPYEEALTREALRVYRRYAVEVVEQLGLCPWAERARQEGHVAERVVLTHEATDLDATLALIEELDQRPEIEIILAIYPRLALAQKAFEGFVRHVRERDGERHPLGEIPFAMAAFHPDSPAVLADPERLIPFLRRTPDPTIQLVRRSVLERVRGRRSQGTAFVDVSQLDLAALDAALSAPEDLRVVIARTNLETVQSKGVEAVEALLADIRQDRDRAYAELSQRWPSQAGT